MAKCNEYFLFTSAFARAHRKRKCILLVGGRSLGEDDVRSSGGETRRVALPFNRLGRFVGSFVRSYIPEYGMKGVP